ncbi:unnamed protein product [Ceratitis capitata]|uniref:(Mediterranean fruit fly) hypothetical protein n=1 Tax=Ceratitis capitata TaxID=7213 RepID=A0A811UU66_CERCA|nr:unnamed protein product [Ceratitis capitata]
MKESLAKTNVVQVEDKKAAKGFLKILGEVTDAVRSWIGNIGTDLDNSRDINSLVSKMNECLNPKGEKSQHKASSLLLICVLMYLS